MPFKPQLMKSTNIVVSHFDNIICWKRTILYETTALNSLSSDESQFASSPCFSVEALENWAILFRHVPFKLANLWAWPWMPTISAFYVLYCEMNMKHELLVGGKKTAK